jgi:AraC family transcriptional regulator
MLGAISVLTLTDRLRPLPENVLSLSTARREWNGVCVDVNEFHCGGRVSHHLRHENETRLSVLLEETGSDCEPRLREDQPCPIAYVPRHMHFAPAGMEMWGFSADARFVRDANLSFDLAVLSERLVTSLNTDAIIVPRLRFSDDRIWTLVKLLSDAVNDPDPSAQLYGDGLIAAIAVRLFANPPGPAAHPARAVSADGQRRLPQRGSRGDWLCRRGAFRADVPEAYRNDTGGMAARPQELTAIP